MLNNAVAVVIWQAFRITANSSFYRQHCVAATETEKYKKKLKNSNSNMQKSKGKQEGKAMSKFPNTQKC